MVKSLCRLLSQSDDDVEIVSIDLDDNDSAHGSGEQRLDDSENVFITRNKKNYKTSRNSDETKDESSKKLVRRRRNQFGQRAAKRKSVPIFESDEESPKNRVRKKNRRSSDSDFEPATKRVKKLHDTSDSDDECSNKRAQKKRKDTVHSDEESFKKRVRKKNISIFDSDRKLLKKRIMKKHESTSDSDEEAFKKRFPKKHESTVDSNEESSEKCVQKKHHDGVVDSVEKWVSKLADDEKDQSFAKNVLEVTMSRKRMKVAPRRERVTAEKCDRADESTSSVVVSGSDLDSDKEKPNSSFTEVSKTPRKRLKVAPKRERVTADKYDEADESTSRAVESGSDLDSDNEKRKSSSTEVSKTTTPMKRLQVVLMREKVTPDKCDNADEATSSAVKSGSDLASDDEKPKRFSTEVSNTSMPRKRKKEAPTREHQPINLMKADEVDDLLDICIPVCNDSCVDSKENVVDCNNEKTESSPKEKSAETEEDKYDFVTVPEQSAFELGFKAKRIIGLTNYGVGGLKCLVEFHGREQTELVMNDTIREYCPELLIKFFEKHITWTKTEG